MAFLSYTKKRQEEKDDTQMNVILTEQRFQKITSVKEHSHNCYEIIIITDGECVIYINDEEFFVQKDSVIILPPQAMHRNSSKNGFTDLYIRTDHLSAIQDKPFIFLDKTETISLLGKALCTTWAQKDYNYQAISSALLSSINEYIIKYKGGGCKYSFVQELKDIIANEFSNCDFDLVKSVLNLGVSKHYLRHCFKEEVGLTPLEYLTDLRIQHAKCLLAQNSYMTIGEIALNCGFNDPYYFSRCFKKNTGVSPREFRNI